MEEKIEYWLALNDYPIRRFDTLSSARFALSDLLSQEGAPSPSLMSIYQLTISKVSENE